MSVTDIPNTFRPAAYALILAEENKYILLTQLAKGPNTGKWSLPGGALEFGESPDEAVCREVFEECGLLLKDPKIIGSSSHLSTWEEAGIPVKRIHNVGSIYHVFFDKRPTIKTSGDKESTAQAQWFHVGSLDAKILSPVGLRGLDLFKQLRSGSRD